MGMFDYLHCELPLPKGGDWLYQTKDTQEWCEMKEYTITREGRLVKREYETEMTPEDELPHRDAPKDSILRFSGCIRKVAGSERDEDQQFDGDLIFYPDISIKDNTHFRATFRGGTCREICEFVDGGWITVWAPAPAPPEGAPR